MGEETLVQASEGLPYAGPHQQTGPANPEDVGGLIVLAMVFFYLLQDATPAEGVSVAVHEASGGPGILEGVPLVPGEELGPAGPALRVRVHPFQKGPQPTLRYLYVAVDEEVIIGLYHLERPVIPAGEAEVLLQLDDGNLGKMALQILLGAVFRGIIGHIYSRIQALAGGKKARQELPEVVLGVVIEYDNPYFHQALKSTSEKARVGTSFDRQGRASSAATSRWFQSVRKLPVMSISLTGCRRFPSLMTKPSMP